jgi:hypothetical protein
MRDRVFRIGERRFRIEPTRIVHQAQRFRLAVEVVTEASAGSTEPDAAARGGNLGASRGTSSTEVPTQKPQVNPSFGEPWEPGEPFSDPHACEGSSADIVKKVEKGSPRSPGSQTSGQSSVCGGEPGWEPCQGGSPLWEVPWLDGVP